MVQLDRSPLTDIKRCGPCDVGLIEGGLCNAENVEVLREFRAQCTLLVAVGACAINGGLPALRNGLDVGTLMRRRVRKQRDPAWRPAAPCPTTPSCPCRWHACTRCTKWCTSTHFLPGCPPSADVIWDFLCTPVVQGRRPQADPALIRYD
jgi:NAD-reducing hydrogenase small subunit